MARETDDELTIRLDDLADPRIAAFLDEHLADMRRTSPPESVHALDLEKLRQPDVRCWTVWLSHGAGDVLVGIGAIKRLSDAHAEVKSMRTGAGFRGGGIASRLLLHMIGDAKARGFRRLSLETGSQTFFAPAWALYQRHGFSGLRAFRWLLGRSQQSIHDNQALNGSVERENVCRPV